MIVHAFDPTAEIAAHLRNAEAINHLPGLVVHETAVDEHNGLSMLHGFRGERQRNEGMNFTASSAKLPGGEQVQAVALDTFCFQYHIDHIDFLKLDIQGNGPATLRGASQLFAKGRINSICLELNRGTASNSPAERAVEQLEQAGYFFSPPQGPRASRPVGSWMRGNSDMTERVRE